MFSERVSQMLCMLQCRWIIVINMISLSRRCSLCLPAAQPGAQWPCTPHAGYQEEATRAWLQETCPAVAPTGRLDQRGWCATGMAHEAACCCSWGWCAKSCQHHRSHLPLAHDVCWSHRSEITMANTKTGFIGHPLKSLITLSDLSQRPFMRVNVYPYRYNGTAGPEWSLDLTFTLWAVTQQACLIQRLNRTYMSPHMVAKCWPWHQASCLSKSFRSELLLIIKWRRPWTSMTKTGLTFSFFPFNQQIWKPEFQK